MKLNPQQLGAIKQTELPLLVLAGAGSGKTRVITQKIAYLIENCGYSPQKIVAVTFTNKAAREMKTRVLSSLHKRRQKTPSICTFHMLGLKIIRSNPQAWHLKSGFTIYDKEDSQNIINDLLAQNRYLRHESAEKIIWHISELKGEMAKPEVVMKNAQTDLEYGSGQIFAAYQSAMRTINAVDLDDLIYLPVIQLKENHQLRLDWQQRVEYMLVDEYQDTNSAQYELLKILTNHHQKFTVVGDDDQSIYSWRGANPTNLKLISLDYPKLEIIKLEQNYRSTERILLAANSLIEKNNHLFSKSLWSRLGLGDPIRVINASDENDEAERVVKAIYAHQSRTGEPYHYYAILYRGNYQARPFERVLREYGISYHLSGSTSFFDRTEVKDILAYLKLIANQNDDNAFLRCVNTPRREIGVATLNKLKAYAVDAQKPLFSCCQDIGFEQQLNKNNINKLKQFVKLIEYTMQSANSNPVAAVQELVNSINYELWLHNTANDPALAQRRMDNVNELITWISYLHKKKPVSISELVQKITVMNILGKDDDTKSDCVHLMTMHAAKGLEFPYVYIVGMEENIIPHHANQTDNLLEEERRIAYVGMTRAQRQLTFSMAEKRKKHGSIRPSIPSRFLKEINTEYLVWDNDPERKSATSEQNKKNIKILRNVLNKIKAPIEDG